MNPTTSFFGSKLVQMVGLGIACFAGGVVASRVYDRVTGLYIKVKKGTPEYESILKSNMAAAEKAAKSRKQPEPTAAA